jgi:hypothetical protein
VTIQRLQRRDARELDGTAMLRRRRQHLGRREDGRQASLCGGDRCAMDSRRCRQAARSARQNDYPRTQT